MIPWIRKYAPKTITEVIGQEQPIKSVEKHIINFKNTKKPILIYGKNGVGKTSSMVALADDKGFELIEMNASDKRNAATITEFLEGVINQGSLFGTDKLIIIDEVEGLSGTKDRGGVQALIKIINKSKYPFVIISEDAYNDKIKAIRKISEVIEYKTLDSEDIARFYEKICEKEKIVYEKSAITQLARMSGGDLRAGLNDLQSVTQKGSLKYEDLKSIDTRDSTQEIENALFRVFKTLNAEIALSAYDNVKEDLDKIFLWVEENIPKEYLNPYYLERAYENLSLADVFYGRIRRWQYYRFYVYCYNLLSVGVALAKEEKNPAKTQYKPSSRLLKIWILNNSVSKRKSIAQKIATKQHTSTKRAFSEIVPYMQIMFKNKDQADKIKKELELSEEEVSWLINK